MIVGSVILAGGRSRRMGRPKESLPFGSSTLLGRTVDTLLACTFPVVVVARDTAQELPPITIEADVVHDDTPGEGPLAAMLAGMRAIADDCDAVFVTGCDAPFLSAPAIDWLVGCLGEHDVAMPQVGGVLQPLFAVYRTSLIPVIARLIGEGVHTPRTLAEVCRTRILTEADIDAFDPARDFLRNVNSPDDYRAALARIQRP